MRTNNWKPSKALFVVVHSKTPLTVKSKLCFSECVPDFKNIMTAMNFDQYTNDQLDAIYYETIGYRPIADDGVSRAEVIETLSEYNDECEAVKIPDFKQTTI